MDAFETVVQMLLEREGYWVRTSYKVALTKEDKRRIRRPSSPRWELDVVAYRGKSNELLVFECKSFLDSRGVCADDLIRSHRTGGGGTYKLFTERTTRTVVLRRLASALVHDGACRSRPRVRLGLVAGRIPAKDRERLKRYFDEQNWELWDDSRLRSMLSVLSEGSYENHVAAVVAKLILRETKRKAADDKSSH